MYFRLLELHIYCFGAYFMCVTVNPALAQWTIIWYKKAAPSQRWPRDAPYAWVPLMSLHRVGQESSSTGSSFPPHL